MDIGIIMLVVGTAVAFLVEYIRRLNLEIKRNFETIKDLRAAKIEFRDKTEYFSDELKKAKAYIKDFETNIEQYEKSSVGWKMRVVLQKAAEDRERLKVSILLSETKERIDVLTLASETNAAVSAEADFARAANQYVGNMKAPIKDYQQQASAVFKNETDLIWVRSHEM